MCELRLSEIESCVAQPQVSKIVLGRGVDIFLALDVVPDGFLQNECILHQVEISLDGIFRQTALLDRLEAIFHSSCVR